MLNSVKSLPLNLSHPFSREADAKENGNKLKDLLLQLAGESSLAEYQSILKSAANAVREKAFGYNRKVTRNKIIKLLQEFECCELVDFVEETKIAINEIKAALDELVKEGKIRIEQRRRWQEAGKHYNNLYYLN